MSDLFPTGLFTEAEVQARVSYRMADFAKQTGCLTQTTSGTLSTAGTRDYPLADNVIDVLNVAFQNSDSVYVNVPSGDVEEVDLLSLDSEDSVDVPYVYSIELGDVNSISFLPPSSNVSNVIHIINTRRPTALADTADNEELDMPSDFLPFIKYGALADLFAKAGEAYDPLRAQVCESIYQLGIQVVRGWVRGELPQARTN